MSLTSTNQSPKEVTQQFFTAWLAGNEDALDSMVFTSGQLGLQSRRQSLEQWMRIRRSYSPLQGQITKLIQEDETVVAFWSAKGRQESELFGLPANSSEMPIHGILCLRSHKGTIQELESPILDLSQVMEHSLQQVYSSVAQQQKPNYRYHEEQQPS